MSGKVTIRKMLISLSSDMLDSQTYGLEFEHLWGYSPLDEAITTSQALSRYAMLVACGLLSSDRLAQALQTEKARAAREGR